MHIDWTKASSDDVEKYRNLISKCLPALSPDIVDCCSPECICHHNVIDSYADTLVNIFLDCAHSSIPSISSTKIQVGTTALMNSEEKRTSGTKCGKRLGALHLEFSLISKRMRRVGINMRFVV